MAMVCWAGRVWLTTVWSLLWLLQLPWTVTAGYNQCMIMGGKCMYHIQLADNCDDDKFITNRVQNDYNERVNEIEKNLGDVKVDHAERIQMLENKLSALLEENKNRPPPTEPPPPVSSPPVGDLGRSRQDGTRHRHEGHSVSPDTITSASDTDTSSFSQDPDRTENSLLTMLHNEFTQLRLELANTKRKLRETERLLRESRRKENATGTELILTTKKLVAMENDLEETQNEKTKLQEELDEKTRELDETSTQLRTTRRNLRDAKADLSATKYQNGNLQKDLEQCHRDLEDLRRVLEQALRKYHELNVKHENTTQTLLKNEEELVECFRGKTAQFCGFEDPGVCGFTQDNETDILDWTRWNKNTPSSRTGPDVDNTCHSKHGYYMYVEATERRKGNNARLTSPRYQGPGEQCMEFHYHMFGRNVGTLNVYTLAIGEGLPPPNWRAFGNQGNVWTLARLSIPEAVARKGYQVVFEAILENGYQGDMALDDIRVFDGTCLLSKTLSELRRDDQDNRRAIITAERNKAKARTKLSAGKGGKEDEKGANT